MKQNVTKAYRTNSYNEQFSMLLLQIFAMKHVETSVLDKFKQIKYLLRNDVSREWLNSSFRFGPCCSFFSFCKLIKLKYTRAFRLSEPVKRKWNIQHEETNRSVCAITIVFIVFHNFQGLKLATPFSKTKPGYFCSIRYLLRDVYSQHD